MLLPKEQGMRGDAVRARLRRDYGDGAAELVRIYRRELAEVPIRPDANSLHRLAGTVGLLGDVELAERLRDASGRPEEDNQDLMRRARELAALLE